MIEYAKHTNDCVINEGGPCTCGTEEVLEDLILEEVNLTAEDFE